MQRRSLRIAAISALAIHVAGCASTPAGQPGTSAAAKNALFASKGQTIVPVNPQSSASAGSELSLPPPTSIPEQIKQAQAFRAQGRLQDAAHILAQLVLAAPDNGQVVGEYGKALVQMARPDDAIAFLKRAIELRSDDWTFYSALGVAYDQRDDRKNAKLAYERALLLRPGDANVLNNYAVSRMLAGDLDGAQKLLLQAQAAGGNNAKITGNLQMLAQMKARRPAAPASKTSVAAATGAPKSITASAPGNTSLGQGPQASTVVMQRVPADPPPKTAHKLTQSAPPVMRETADTTPKIEHSVATSEKDTVVKVAVTKPTANKDAGTKGAPTKIATASAPAANTEAVKSATTKPATTNSANMKPAPTKIAVANTPVSNTAAANTEAGKSAKPATANSAVAKMALTKNAAANTPAARTKVASTTTVKPAATKPAGARSADTKLAAVKAAAAKAPPALRTADQGE